MVEKSLNRTLSVLAILRAKDEADRLEKIFESIPGVHLKVLVDKLDAASGAVKSAKAPNILLVEINAENEEEIQILSKAVQEASSDLAVLATAKDAPLSGIRQLMHLGVVDFIPQPFEAVDIASAMEASIKFLTRRTGHHLRDGKIISLLRSSGGVGTTTMAVQIAADIVERYEKNELPPSVCLLDFDLQFGNVGLTLDLQGGPSLYEVLEAHSRIDAAFLRTAISHHASGIDVLTAPPVIVPLDSMSSKTAKEILRICREEYDFVIVDLPHAWTSWTSDVLAECDVVLVAVVNSVTSLFRARQLLELIKDQKLEGLPSVVVVNRAQAHWWLPNNEKQFEKSLGHIIDHHVRNDPKSAVAARERGILLKEIEENSQIEKDIHSLINKLATTYDLDGHLVDKKEV